LDKGKKVLIVEDESITAMAMEAYIMERGYEVVGQSATGEDAVRMARSEAPDLVFMDFRLAGAMDGVEAAMLICSERRIPIVMISGYAERIVLEKASDFKPAAFLLKPINFDDIDKIMESIRG
jgi:two-component system, response regulator PdtaR